MHEESASTDTDRVPGNAAAEQVVRALSVITDLTVQLAEVQAAISRQQDLIDVLMPVAQWRIDTMAGVNA